MTQAAAHPSAEPLACVILAAGMGTRMQSRLPKVLHRVAGLPMVSHVVAAAEALGAARIVVVVGPDMEAVSEAVAPHPTAIQEHRNGTADALAAARPVLGDFAGTVLVLYGDSPLVTADTLSRLCAARAAPDDPAAVVLGVRLAEPGAYGRLIESAPGALDRIVEAADATAAEQAVTLCNGGLMALDGRGLWSRLERIGNANAKGEYYLTDLVAVSRAEGRVCRVVEGAAEEFLGVNSRADLAQVEAVMQARLRAHAMAGGVTLTDPASVFLAADTALGRDVVIGPNTVFGPGVSVADDVEIRGFCHIEGTQIGAGARVGPFARLRPGTVLGPKVQIGNFVEAKNAVFGAGAKASHLSYLGDATIGAEANIGAGTITCNYDGFLKYRTEIGAGAFIGSNSALVAPATIGAGAIVGAGSVVTDTIPADALAVARGRQELRPGWAASFRAKKAAEKAAKQK